MGTLKNTLSHCQVQLLDCIYQLQSGRKISALPGRIIKSDEANQEQHYAHPLADSYSERIGNKSRKKYSGLAGGGVCGRGRAGGRAGGWEGGGREREREKVRERDREKEAESGGSEN